VKAAGCCGQFSGRPEVEGKREGEGVRARIILENVRTVLIH